MGPIRGEVLGADRLAERARHVARAHRLAPPQKRRGPEPLLKRLDSTRVILGRVYSALNDGAEREVDISPAGEWFLDNFYIIQEHIREVRTSLPHGYYHELPKLLGGPLADHPRVYEVATELIAHTEGHLDLENITLFVNEYQRVAPLKLGELWAIPAMLRLGLVENIRRMALRLEARLQEVAVADLWAIRLHTANQQSDQALSTVLKEFVDHHPRLTPTFVARFLQQLRGYQSNFTPLVWLEQWIAEDGPTTEEAVTRSNRRVALTQITVVNCIMSLRTIGRLDWKAFVESQSAMEHVLREDPTGDYVQMAFGSRDQYRHVVEWVAKRSLQAEEDVARLAIQLAGAGKGRERHVGFYLVGEGRARLEQATAYASPWRERLHRFVLRHPNGTYFGGILVATLAFLALAWKVADPSGTAQQTLLILLSAIAVNDVAINLVNQLVTYLLPPRTIPRMEYREGGIPEECRTVVVVPTLFGNISAVREALEHVEVQFLANRDPQLHFAILSDYTDASAQRRDEDDGIVAAAAAGIEALNAKYATSVRAGDAFYLFHRDRLWNEKQSVWMGWERKRGKLAQFNKFLRGGAEDAFSTVVGDTVPLQTARYVITLDSDTILPRDAAQLLVGTMAHPLNRPVYDGGYGRVINGYGIMQPRIGVSLTSAHRSRFAAIHSGHPGVDPYTTAVSDVYQDLYAEGSFAGKGIYDLDAFERATEGRFPENRLLSHDLIEGTYSRAALVTDIQLYDDYPTRYLAFTRRKHRWIRGDWQISGWLRDTVPGPAGAMRNRLSTVSRWKIFDNLRRSVVEISQLVMLVGGWLWLDISAVRWTGVTVGTIGMPWIISLALAAVRPPMDQSWMAYYAAVWRDWKVSVQQIVLAVVFLPHQAVISADAIIRTLVRLGITKTNLLEWQTASQVERTMGGGQSEVWRKMWPVPAMTAAFAAGLVFAPSLFLPGIDGVHASDSPIHIPTFIVALTTLGLWTISPAIASALSAPAIPRAVNLTEGERQAAFRYARLHWHFFERFVSEETHGLAPDNFQEDPSPVVAMRTSPTNIGLQLLSIVSASDLGFIGRDEMLDKVESVFRAMERMRRFRGHFFNWYELTELRVLEPAYISTVDSGNFAGHLIALKQACLTLVETGGPTADQEKRLLAIANRANDYALEMDFTFLFDEKRKLFSIGYRHSNDTLDNSFYDLLASEARLASFVAIAKDDVDPEHWFRLGRSLSAAAGTQTLLSWSGSMFEYLMPVLVMQSFPFTLLDQTYRGAVRRHIAYGAERGVPWGISESAYNARDRNQTYQYRGFGVPELALKRGLRNDLVVAPYATMLAMLVEPHQAIRNLTALEAEGALGPYGFREAIDYTRPIAGSKRAVVGAYFAHHVGMSIVALTNALKRQLWQRRFHSDPLVRSAELMLHERIPRRLTVQNPPGDESVSLRAPRETEKPAAREIDTPNTSQPRIAILGNPPYTILLTNAGGGYSRYGTAAVTRWRADGTRDSYGQWCYLRDVTTGRVWSTSYQPSCVAPSSYSAVFAADRVSFVRRDGDIETLTEIAVVSEDAAEVRRVTVINRSSAPREIEFTSYGEIVLAPQATDRAHPAFGNLFVETEWLEKNAAILASRRPRSNEEQTIWCAHVVAVGPEVVGDVTYETDRGRFIGRGKSRRFPAAMEESGELTGTVGAVLDPIFALRVRVRVPAGRSARVSFTTIAAEDRRRAVQLADLYHDPYSARRALDLSWAQAQAEMRDLGIGPADAALYQQLAGHLLFPHPALRLTDQIPRAVSYPQETLWPQGISGDWPILLATIDTVEGMPSVRQLLHAHQYWRLKGVTSDLVIINDMPSSYLQHLQEELMATVMASSEAALLDRPGGVFIRRADLLKPDELTLLRSLARIHVECDGLGLGNFLEFTDVEPEYPAPLASSPPSRGGTAKERHPAAQDSTAGAGLALFNGLGGFGADGAYEIRLTGMQLPPAPWANVVANAEGGFCVSEAGSGFTWAESSYFYRLTPWHNDPVRDPSTDCIYLRDEQTGEVWCPTPSPIRDASPYTVRHGAGWSTFDHDHNGVSTSLRIGLAPAEAVRISTLTVRNAGTVARRITLTQYSEWVLGVTRDQAQHHVITRFDEKSSAVFANNSYDSYFSRYVAFAAMSETLTAFTSDRREFLGRNGSTSNPRALERGGLTGRTGPSVDPCAALQTELTLEPGESRQVVFLLGAARGEAAAREAVARYRGSANAVSAIDRTNESWKSRLSVVKVKTPDESFDVLFNGWLLYQALSCRMLGRSAVYQSSGAYGFRDQLQDSTALLYAEPGMAREQIVRAAGRQFVEGDVQHWWHPQTGRGVRTRFSDDLVWLPYVVDRYITVTGDESVLDEAAPFLSMRELNPDEDEVYDLPQTTEEQAPVYEHCLRALKRACTKGSHGLPLIGSGDWNDGMNRVGIEGRGESVWLAWFLIATLRPFADICERRGDASSAAALRATADEYVEAVELHAWDGEWYRRAYFDDGSPLGSKESGEAKIDSIAQSWSVISGAAKPERARQAMQSLYDHLVDKEAGLVVLLKPPFDETTHNPGYIRGYVPGVRENGAQYTHAALWAVLATALQGDGDRAYELYQMINPISHTQNADEIDRYKVEPYVVAADVYTAKDHYGRGGWTWYTGSAGWMYRVALEAILGFTKRGDTLRIEPRIPAEWNGFSISYRHGGSTYDIDVRRDPAMDEPSVSVDGVTAADGVIQLRDDGASHSVIVNLSRVPAQPVREER
ncbi:MAG: GH36-type glycosyl hydrolase domain-containing protein [Gemmatimonadaceae bacterium]